MVITDLILIGIITVILIDLSGFITQIKKWICKFLKKPYQDFTLKPIDCSFCMTHHLGLIYLLLTKELTLITYTFLLLIAFSTPIIKDLFVLFKDLMGRLMDGIYNRYIS